MTPKQKEKAQDKIIKEMKPLTDKEKEKLRKTIEKPVKTKR